LLDVSPPFTLVNQSCEGRDDAPSSADQRTGTEWSDVNSNNNSPTRVKLFAAVVGGSAIVALGALGVVFTENTSSVVSDPATPVEPFPTSESPAPEAPLPPDASTAVTTTATTPPLAPETPFATPGITTTPTSAEPG
jgi:hypothetical protein